jgi:hypothetical protein
LRFLLLSSFFSLFPLISLTVRHVDDRQDDGLEARVEQVRFGEFVFELGRPRQHEPRHVWPVAARHKDLRGRFRHLAHVVVPLLQAQARKAQRGLAAAAVLLGEFDRKFVQDLRAEREG